MSNQTFHTGNGWNYGYKSQKDGSVRPFRYHTNGHQNGSKEFAHFSVHCKYLPENHEEASSLFAAPSFWGQVNPDVR